MALPESTHFVADSIYIDSETTYPPNAHELPIWMTSAFGYSNTRKFEREFARGGPVYSRLAKQNPNLIRLETKFASISKGANALAYASGMAAISSCFLALTKSGDEILASDVLYGCTTGLLQDDLPRFGVHTKFVPMKNAADVIRHLTPRTKFVYLETLGNPTLHTLEDWDTFAGAVGVYGAKVIVDNTFCSPYVFTPLQCGAYITLESGTKFISGSGKVTIGLAAFSEEAVQNGDFERACRSYGNLGTAASPFDAWLTENGLVTLGLRMPKHNANAKVLADFLRGNNPRVKAVYSEGEERGGIVYFELHGGYGARERFMNYMAKHEGIVLTVSLGFPETGMCCPAKTTHLKVPDRVKRAAGITPNGIRTAVGIEETEGLIKKFQKGLRRS